MMSNKKLNAIIRVAALLLAFAMLAGCRSNAGDESYYSYWEEEVVGGGNQDGTTASDGSGGAVTSGGGNTASGSGTGTGSGTSGTVNPEDYRGTTVRFATWKDPYKQEDGAVIDAFQKKYGIKVQIDTVAQDDYVQTISGMVAAGNSPDVFFDNGVFPASISVLQPLDAMQLDLTDPIWEQGIINLTTFGGKPFLLNSVGNIWSEVDCLFYNKRIFADNNIRTPEEYYNAGSWTYDAFEKCMVELKNAGYVGAYIDYQALLGAADAGFYKLSNGKVVNSVDSMTAAVLKRMSDWASNGLINSVSGNDWTIFRDGKAGMSITNAYGLKKNGYFPDMNPDDLGFTYIPDYSAGQKAVQTGLFRGWGLIRGAKNPVGAGIFLRYYLDVSNYDLNSAFISSAAQSFFFKLTTGVSTDQKNAYILRGVTQINAESMSDYRAITDSASSQIDGILSSNANRYNTNAQKVNDRIATELSALGLK